VDDDDPVRAVTVAMLLDLGYRVRHAASGEAALKVLAKNGGIEILLTDLVMLGMTGTQLAVAVRALQPDLSVVFMSGYADQIEDTLTPGDRFIRKPFSANDLYHTIESVVADRRRLSESVRAPTLVVDRRSL
jgi:CheY-like chemotaxis protein